MLTIDFKKATTGTKCTFCGHEVETPSFMPPIVMCASQGHAGVVLCERRRGQCPGIQTAVPVCEACWSAYDDYEEETEK